MTNPGKTGRVPGSPRTKTGGRTALLEPSYSSGKNLNTVADFHATPYIPFRSNTTGRGCVLWEHMYHMFMFKKESFLQHYHKRSNVESTFSMLKRKFGDSLRSKSPVAMVNEAYLKALCHNIVVLIHEMHELGVDPVFWQSAESC